MSSFVEIPSEWEELTEDEKEDFVNAFLIGIRPLFETASADEGTRSGSTE